MQIYQLVQVQLEGGDKLGLDVDQGNKLDGAVGPLLHRLGSKGHDHLEIKHLQHMEDLLY
jgi:hypothetical protein